MNIVFNMGVKAQHRANLVNLEQSLNLLCIDLYGDEDCYDNSTRTEYSKEFPTGDSFVSAVPVMVRY